MEHRASPSETDIFRYCLELCELPEPGGRRREKASKGPGAGAGAGAGDIVKERLLGGFLWAVGRVCIYASTITALEHTMISETVGEVDVSLYKPTVWRNSVINTL